ncbi:DNA mismatch repair protein MutS [Candidatus Omnitrophus magneticus]|uniref:DNA mismatch repair protein MutS n=1 Tax=Candidatus Omnitrophus magneticus TaxID=1609969 RepID=A0A0F0CJ24_9BACT|nr:DNA mismatch repair protein MutS [Candidatus Omnitrophus magneticus]
MEYNVFCRLREQIALEMSRLKKAAERIATLDVLASLSETAIKNSYTRPILTETKNFQLVEARHPVLELLLKDKEFVSNNLTMNHDEGNIFIITGSNMAGKSTFIREIALITIMAQMGSFVPAQKAEIGIVDRVFTRVGASDRLQRGMSTFMMEMIETANILNNATSKSLIILDEIGRGTSTYDGVSIAWAVVEYIQKKFCGARTLFATHFHELTELTNIYPNIKNYNLATREWKDEIIFLYKVIEGSSDESFGIHVARLAGMPNEVVLRARDILNNLQKDSLFGNVQNKFLKKEKNTGIKEHQFNFFEPQINTKADDIMAKIKNMDLDSITPIQALQKLSEIKKEISG